MPDAFRWPNRLRPTRQSLIFWHGRQSDRGYATRWKLLVDNDFDPDTDLTRDDVGLYRFSGNKPRLQEAIFDYFRSRDEDATGLDRAGHAKI